MINALYISLLILFVNYCFLPGSIFGTVGELVELPITNPLLRWISKPIFGCTVCMAPAYTLLTWLVRPELITHSVAFTAMIVGGLNVLLSSIIGFLNSYNGLERDIKE